MVKIPERGRRTRWIVAIFGGILFFWLRLEDNSVWSVVSLGAGLALLTIGWTTMGKLGGREVRARYLIPGAALLGGLTGLGASLATTALMILKTGMHGHLFPDYPPGEIIALLQRIPIWMLAGGLVGFGLALAWWARHD